MNTTDSRLHKPGVIGSSPIAAICKTGAELYHAWSETSCSDLKLLDKSPQEFYWRKIAKSSPPYSSAAMDYGTLLHTWGEVGEEAFWPLTVTPDESLCTATGAIGAKAKAWLADQPADRIPISPSDRKKLRDQTQALLANPDVRRLIAEQVDAEFNIRSVWEGHPVRARVDGCTEEGGFDWKTTSEKYPFHTWARPALQYGYHLQSAMYAELLTHAGYPRNRLKFIVTSTVFPYENFVCQLPDDVCQAGHRRCLALLEELAFRKEWNDWTRHNASGVVELPVPAYLTKGL